MDNKRYIKVGNKRITVDIHLYREFNRLRKQQYDANNLYRNNTQELKERLIFSPYTDAEETIIETFLIESLNKALSKLSDEERHVIHEIFYCEVSERVLAKDLGVSQ